MAQDALVAGKGAVVLFPTVAAGAGFPNHVAIADAEGGGRGADGGARRRAAPPVRANCAAPSLTRSAMSALLTGNARMTEAIAKQHPIPHLGEGEDSAALAAGWIIGQVFAGNGRRSRG